MNHFGRQYINYIYTINNFLMVYFSVYIFLQFHHLCFVKIVYTSFIIFTCINIINFINFPIYTKLFTINNSYLDKKITNAPIRNYNITKLINRLFL